jgi:glycolate oxidase FAD binding subunit
MSTPTALRPEDAIAHLASIAGQGNASLRGDLIEVAPARTQQIAEILRFAQEHGLAVTPTGSGTKMGWGNPVPTRIRLSMERMRSVREHSWQDMTCTVDTGCAWAAMQAEFARHGQMVALDPLWPDRATIGGIVAANDGGAMRMRYGGLRDLIIGMTIVLADGTIARTGGKVVKNVAGYDLHKLMTGSYGTLGVIADVNFRLHPIEEHTRTWSAAAPDAAQFELPLLALLDAQIVPSCVQIRANCEGCALDIRIAAVPHCLDELAVRLEKIFAPLALQESKEQVWQARQELFDGDRSVVLKVSTLSSELCKVISELQQRAASGGVEVDAVAQANGLMTLAFSSEADSAAALVEHLRKQLRGSGGSVVALRLPDEMRGRFDVWGCDSNALPLMREIKRRFDPHRILNPGRFAGNI